MAEKMTREHVSFIVDKRIAELNDIASGENWENGITISVSSGGGALQVRSGPTVDLPTVAVVGELLWDSDAELLYAGTGTSVVEVGGSGAAVASLDAGDAWAVGITTTETSGSLQIRRGDIALVPSGLDYGELALGHDATSAYATVDVGTPDGNVPIATIDGTIPTIGVVATNALATWGRPKVLGHTSGTFASRASINSSGSKLTVGQLVVGNGPTPTLHGQILAGNINLTGTSGNSNIYDGDLNVGDGSASARIVLNSPNNTGGGIKFRTGSKDTIEDSSGSSGALGDLLYSNGNSLAPSWGGAPVGISRIDELLDSPSPLTTVEFPNTIIWSGGLKVGTTVVPLSQDVGQIEFGEDDSAFIRYDTLVGPPGPGVLAGFSLGADTIISGDLQIANTLWVGVSSGNTSITMGTDDPTLSGDYPQLSYDATSTKFTFNREVIADNISPSAVKIDVAGAMDFDTYVGTDTVSEHTPGAGVTIDGLLIKDGGIVAYDDHIADVTTNPHDVALTGLDGFGVSLPVELTGENIGIVTDPAFSGTAGADKFGVTQGVQGATDSFYSLHNFTVAGFATDVMRGFYADMDIAAGSGGFALYEPRAFEADIVLTNSGTAFAGLKPRLFKGSINAGALSIDGSTPIFEVKITNTASTQTFAEGGLSVDIEGGDTGETIAAYTRARVGGSANGLGYRGYAIGDSGHTGDLIGVQGYVVNNRSTTACIVAVDGDVIGTTLPADQVMGSRVKGHAFVRGGSMICIENPLTLCPDTLTPDHVDFLNNAGELYVENDSEFDGEVFLDGNETHSLVSVTANYTAADKTNIYCDASGGAFSVTLTASVGREYEITKTDSSSNAVTIIGTVNGVTDPDIVFQHDSVRLQYTGTEWSIR